MSANAGSHIGQYVAANSGTIIDLSPASSFDFWVRLQHSDGMVTTYGHNHHERVYSGQSVQRQHIAEVGNRGASTGRHVHVQIKASGQPVDPVLFYQ